VEERRQRPRPKLWRHAQTLSGAATGEAEGSSLRKRQRGALSSGPAPAQPFDASPPRAAIAEAEGLQLHLSSSSSSGYKGVREVAPGRFQARLCVGGVNVSCGYFGTAVAAAVAYARHASGEAAAATGAALAQEGGGQAVGQWTREEGRAGQPCTTAG